jgi:uncharacterized protein YdhG (YjbR/CyaY superfamily)
VKKMKSRRGSGGNRNDVPKDVEQYLDRISEPARSTLKKIRAVIRSVVPPETTEIISYRIPAFRYKGVLVWYAAFSDHCSLFPTASVIEAFKKELDGFSISKGTIHFPTDKVLACFSHQEIGEGTSIPFCCNSQRLSNLSRKSPCERQRKRNSSRSELLWRNFAHHSDDVSCDQAHSNRVFLTESRHSSEVIRCRNRICEVRPFQTRRNAAV